MNSGSNSLVRRLACSALALAAWGATGTVHAECPCQSGGRASAPPYADSSMMMTESAYSPEMMSAAMGVGPTFVGMTDGMFAPPPGTLGQTYQLKSRPVPAETHPRIGMIDIHVPGASNVVVHDVNPYRLEDALEGFRDAQDPTLWHFSSKALLPGQPHIYRVEATIGGLNGMSTSERYVRLIRGRVVELNF